MLTFLLELKHKLLEKYKRYVIPLIILGLCFLVVFVAGFATGQAY